MPAFLVPLHEFNPCHNPDGAGGGQFCSSINSPRARTPLPFTRRKSSVDDRYSHRLYMNRAERREWDQLFTDMKPVNQALLNAERAEMQRHDPYNLLAKDSRWHVTVTTPEITAGRAKVAEFYEKMRTIEDRAARRVVGEIATELGFTGVINIINDPNPRKFKVGDKSWNEGGHYQPATNTIQVNIHNSNGIDLVKLVAHEVAHAKFEQWQSDMGAESERLRTWEPAGAAETRSKSFLRADGMVYPQFLATFRREFPAHAAVMDVWGSYYATAETARDLSAKMYKDDGFTDYSRSYWEATKGPNSSQIWSHQSHTGRTITGTPFYRAVDETLAEVAAWRVGRRMGVIPMAANTPSKEWRKFSARLTGHARGQQRRARPPRRPLPVQSLGRHL
jgi:hypothetical protein